jgi:hypothetical protein
MYWKFVGYCIIAVTTDSQMRLCLTYAISYSLLCNREASGWTMFHAVQKTKCKDQYITRPIDRKEGLLNKNAIEELKRSSFLVLRD